MCQCLVLHTPQTQVALLTAPVCLVRQRQIPGPCKRGQAPLRGFGSGEPSLQQLEFRVWGSSADLNPQGTAVNSSLGYLLWLEPLFRVLLSYFYIPMSLHVVFKAEVSEPTGTMRALHPWLPVPREPAAAASRLLLDRGGQGILTV